MVIKVKESIIEGYLTLRVQEFGGLCEKHVSPGLRGVPDRLVTWRDGRMFLVELKATNGKLAPWQKRDHARRLERGVRVWTLHNIEAVEEFVNAIAETEVTT